MLPVLVNLTLTLSSEWIFFPLVRPEWLGGHGGGLQTKQENIKAYYFSETILSNGFSDL